MPEPKFIDQLLEQKDAVRVNKTNRIFIDIETYAGDNKPSLDSIEAPANYTKPETIAKYKEENQDKVWRKQALHSLKGEIICIAFAVNDSPVQCLFKEKDKYEIELMMEFEEAVSGVSYPCWIGHNFKRFDNIWLVHRAIKYKLGGLKSMLPQRNSSYKYDTDCIDTMELFAVTSHSSDSWYSLESISEFLGLGKKESSGADIHDMYVQGKYDEIISHCKKDIELVRDIYNMV